MATWNSRGLRGSLLEELINRTNEQYREKKLALIQKVPTPITPIKIDKESRHIIPVCFDAKECHSDAFPLANIHEHQVRFMQDFESQGGVAFLLLYFAGRDAFYYLRFEEMMRFWERGASGGKKHFRFDELDQKWILTRERDGVLLPYLKGLQMDLELRD